MKSRTYEPHELASGETYKFVKVSDQYRFAKIVTDHCDMIEAQEKSAVTAAGAVVVYDDEIWKGRNYSMTLKIGCTDLHWEELSKLLNKPIAGSLL